MEVVNEHTISRSNQATLGTKTTPAKQWNDPLEQDSGESTGGYDQTRYQTLNPVQFSSNETDKADNAVQQMFSLKDQSPPRVIRPPSPSPSTATMSSTSTMSTQESGVFDHVSSLLIRGHTPAAPTIESEDEGSAGEDSQESSYTSSSEVSEVDHIQTLLNRSVIPHQVVREDSQSELSYNPNEDTRKSNIEPNFTQDDDLRMALQPPAVVEDVNAFDEESDDDEYMEELSRSKLVDQGAEASLESKEKINEGTTLTPTDAQAEETEFEVVDENKQVQDAEKAEALDYRNQNDAAVAITTPEPNLQESDEEDFKIGATAILLAKAAEDEAVGDDETEDGGNEIKQTATWLEPEKASSPVPEEREEENDDNFGPMVREIQQTSTWREPEKASSPVTEEREEDDNDDLDPINLEEKASLMPADIVKAEAPTDIEKQKPRASEDMSMTDDHSYYLKLDDYGYDEETNMPELDEENNRPELDEENQGIKQARTSSTDPYASLKLERQRKAKRKKCIILAVVALILVGLAVGLGVAFGKKKEDEPTGGATIPPTPSDKSSGGNEPLTIQGTDDFTNAGTSVSISDNGQRVAVGGDGSSDYILVNDITVNGVNTAEDQKIYNTQNAPQFATSLSLSGDGNRIALASFFNGNNTHMIEVYDNSGGSWNALGNSPILVTLSNDSASGYEEILSLSLSKTGEYIAIGFATTSSSPEKGYVRVYKLESGDWNMLGSELQSTESGAGFGKSVSISGDGSRLGIGAYLSSSYAEMSGSVFIYQYSSDSSWKELGDPITGGSDNFKCGYSVSLSEQGDVIAIGSPFASLNSIPTSGQVTIYAYDSDGNQWNKRGSAFPGETDGGKLGEVVSLSGDGMHVAMSSKQNNGVVNIYEFTDGENWLLTRELQGKAANGDFGHALSLNNQGDFVVVGAPGEGNGVTYFYKTDSEEAQQ